MAAKATKAAKVEVVVPIVDPDAELNDAEWRAFLFGISTDCRQHDGSGPVPALFQQLSECMSSGIRQRFCVINKSDLLNWASDIAKNYDMCKEVKARLEGSQVDNEITDLMMAKLVKLRLLILKHEGIEQRKAAKALALKEEESEPPPAPVEAPEQKGGKVAPKKDEKDKDKDARGKLLSPKKGAAKAPSKSEVAPSRPTSGQDGKRKSKFKERGGKSDSKTAAVGDEPENGPDAYYWLKDFNSPGLITALTEVCNIDVQAFFTIECCPGESPSTPFETVDENREEHSCSFPPKHPYRSSTSRPIVTLREWIFTSDESSPLRNICWCDIRRGDFADAKELFDNIATKTYSLLKEREIYDSFYANEKILNIPLAPSNLLDDSSPDMRLYRNILHTSAPLCTESLLGMLLHIATDEETSIATQSKPDQCHIRTDLSLYRDTGMRFNVLGNMKFSHEKNEISKITAASPTPHLFGKDFNQLLEGMRNLYPICQEQLGNVYESASAAQKSKLRKDLMKKSAEARKFSSFSDPYREKLEILLEFEDMLGISVDSHKVSLNAWCWSESLDKSSLAQELQTTKLFKPSITSRKSERDGRLLLAMHGPGPVASEHFETFEEVKVKTRVNFGLFHDLYDSHKSVLDPYRKVTTPDERTDSGGSGTGDPQTPLTAPEPTSAPFTAEEPQTFPIIIGNIDLESYPEELESTLSLTEDEKQVIKEESSAEGQSGDSDVGKSSAPPTASSDVEDSRTVYNLGDAVVHEVSKRTVLYPSSGAQVRITKEVLSGLALNSRDGGGKTIQVISGGNILTLYNNSSGGSSNSSSINSTSLPQSRPQRSNYLSFSCIDNTYLYFPSCKPSSSHTGTASQTLSNLTSNPQTPPVVSINSSIPYPFSSSPNTPNYSVASLSLPNGLMVEMRSNGSVLLRREHFIGQTMPVPSSYQIQNGVRETFRDHQYLQSAEVARSILPNGTVVRYFSSGLADVLFPNGNTSSKLSDGSWLNTNHLTGSQTTSNNLGEKVTLPSLTVVREEIQKDPTSPSSSEKKRTRRIKIIRQDYVTATIISKGLHNAMDSSGTAVPTINANFDVTVEHPDQTRLKTSFSMPVKPQYGAGRDIGEDFESELYGTAQGRTEEEGGAVRIHSEKTVISNDDIGVTVTVKDGGMFSRLDFFNGTSLQRRFNADGDYEFQLIRDDCIVDVASKGGGKFVPRGAFSSHSKEMFTFNWIFGSLQVEDATGSLFTVSGDGSYEIEKPLKSAGLKRNEQEQKPLSNLDELLKDDAKICEQDTPRNPPRLFVVEPDGSGFELLRDVDIVPYLQKQRDNPDATIVQESIEDDPDAIGINVVTKLDRFEGISKLCEPLVTYRTHFTSHGMGRSGRLIFCNCLFWCKVCLSLVLAVSGLLYFSYRVYDLRRYALAQEKNRLALNPNDPSSAPVPIPTNPDGSPTGDCFYKEGRLARLEPDSPRMMMGFHLDWATDNPTAITNRLGKVAPAVINAFMKIDMTNITMPFDVNTLRWHGYEVQKVRGMLELTLEPVSDIAQIPDDIYDLIGRELRDINSQKGVPVLLRYGHEMNGDWVLAYGYRPIAFKTSFRKMATAIRRYTNMTAMVWAPNVGTQYPFNAAPGDKSAERPPKGSEEFRELDTDGNGEIASGDDPYGPFYPGDEYVDWVGLSVYFYPIANNDLNLGRPNLNVEVPGPTYLREQVNLENIENQVPTPKGTTTAAFKAMLDFYTRFCTERNKPMMIPETGAPFVLVDDHLERVPARSGELTIKQAWWSQVWSQESINTWPKLKLAVQFEETKWQNEKFQNWAVTNASNYEVLPAFNQFIQNSRQIIILGADMSFRCDGSIVLNS
ncbi:hypothetical protein HDU97_006343 [Phlyctochytrium planicorne]|nr:hypothetical protein HDU97_006343 [Phlyctochytrium planicorne]